MENGSFLNPHYSGVLGGAAANRELRNKQLQLQIKRCLPPLGLRNAQRDGRGTDQHLRCTPEPRVYSELEASALTPTNPVRSPSLVTVLHSDNAALGATAQLLSQPIPCFASFDLSRRRKTTQAMDSLLVVLNAA